MVETEPALTVVVKVSRKGRYNRINQVSIRYGSSAQYFFTGAQIFLQNMFDAENATKRDQIASLGGNALVGAACVGATAAVYLNLPHNSPRADGKPLPFASDLDCAAAAA